MHTVKLCNFLKWYGFLPEINKFSFIYLFHVETYDLTHRYFFLPVDPRSVQHGPRVSTPREQIYRYYLITCLFYFISVDLTSRLLITTFNTHCWLYRADNEWRSPPSLIIGHSNINRAVEYISYCSCVRFSL